MPTYGYRCEKNGHEFEVVQGITDPPLTRCKVCGSKVRRTIYPVGIVFKGSGFYKTDSRGSSVLPATDGDKSSSDKDKSASDGDKIPADTGGSSEKTATVKKADPKKSKGDAKGKKSA